ncbi:MAG: hypothetical protein EOR11_19955 [Mesorhizobium sp.]|uniref:hypothetical protein n=1 Tax=Mesorhizobium sp. TaxID=1871066 RepID=UPI000FE9C185|nr:hypothetical protein [Mesorhizobium sp.]RWP84737.1 MAG: hypothetical protein EOR11_19955 [Mesorhizobium sp.]
MADEKTEPSAGEKAIADGRLEVSSGGGVSSSLEQGGKAVTTSTDGVMLDVSDEGTEQQGLNAHHTELEVADETTEAGDEEKKAPEEDDKPTDEAATYEPLPDFDPASEEVTAKYDERFLTEHTDEADGSKSVVLNREAIADEIRANMAKAEGATERPNEGTYKYLKEKLGITRDLVDAAIEGEKAKFTQAKAAMDEVTGGEEAWSAKIAWASTSKAADGKDIIGGYSKEQVARFNAAMKEGGEAAREQIELLNERYAKANPTTATTQPVKKAPGIGVQRRPASPEKSTSSGANTLGGAGAVKPFATKDDYNKELANVRAMKSGAEQDAKHRELRARTAVSPWWKAQQQGR